LALVAASTGARSEVEAGLASLGLGRGDLDLAEEAGVLTVGGARVDLAHPLLGSAAYQTVPVADRAGIRRVLATEEARAPRVRLPVDAGAGNDTWTVELLGSFAVRRGGDDVTPTANHSAQAIKLVALKGPVTVDELVDGMWPEAAEGVGRVRLRNVLNRVRVTCGPVLVRDGDLVRLTRGTSVDALRFEEAAAKALVALGSGEDGAAGRALAAVEAYTGELLPADRYVAWASAPRERLSRRYLELLDTLAEESERTGDLGATVRLLELAMDLDPYDESRYVRAARLLAEHGRRAAALSLLHQARVVAEEMGVPLSSTAERLVESLGAGPGRAKASISTST
jgi:DNA-binding SARP family transcriptional activator